MLQNNYHLQGEICRQAGNLNLLNLPQAREALIKGIDGLWREGILNAKMTQKLKNSFPTKFNTVANSKSETRPFNTRFVCSKCGTHICLEVEHCPSCGAKLSK